MVSSPATLPHWDFSGVYPGIDSPEFLAGMDEVRNAIARLERIVAESCPPERLGQPVDEGTVATYDALTTMVNDVLERFLTINAFVSGFTAVDSRHEEAQARASELRRLRSRFAMASTRYTAWVGSLDVEALIARSSVAKDHQYAVRRAVVEATHLMSQSEEDLRAELTLSGGSAWGKLHDDITSQIVVAVEKTPGQTERLPMSEVRNLAMHPDREVRRRAYEAELAAWDAWATPITAALNGVTGEHLTIAQRRNWGEVLDEAVFQNHIDRSTLDAMMDAARRAYPDLRRYLKAKALMLGLDALAWYDLFAPMSSNARAWDWDQGVEFIFEQFGTYSDQMRGLAERAVAERWIDAEPRAGKIGGAFCMGVRPGESRILANFTPAWDGVNTLAHELGHAYHNLCDAERTAIQRIGTPMTLAETASTFCETILRQAAIAHGSEQDQLTILEASLQDATQTIGDISSRFLFEQSVFARRGERELSADEFRSLMVDAQRQTYGDGLDETRLHPYMWAVKSHYYSPGYAFYNYPYMFGMLFGLGLYARYQQDPDAFRASYDDLLSATGMADAAELADRFGIDIRTSAFWESSLDVVRADVDRFEALSVAMV